MYVRIILGFLKENAVITTTTTTPQKKNTVTVWLHGCQIAISLKAKWSEHLRQFNL